MGHSDTYTLDSPYNLKLNRGENKSTKSLHNMNNINIRHRRKSTNLKLVNYPTKKLISYLLYQEKDFPRLIRSKNGHAERSEYLHMMISL